MTNFNFVKNKNYFLIFSGILIVVSLVFVIMWGLKPGLDFTGGSLVEVNFKDQRPANQEIEDKLASLVGKPSVIPVGEQGAIIKMKLIDEAQHQQVLSSLRELTGSTEINSIIEKRFEMIGPTVSSDLRSKSFWAVFFVLLAIIIYIAFAFRKVSRSIQSWKYGVCAVLALFHDIIIPIGVFAALGHFMGIEVDTLFITALLTVLGFSVHDTIVVFDRIRENLYKFSRENFEEIVNRSINQTLTRSINTSLTVLLVLLATFFFGGESVKYFVLTLIIGVTFGTYSSIFIASPLLVTWNRLSHKKGV